MKLMMDVVGKQPDGRVNFKGRATDDPAFLSSDSILTMHLSEEAAKAVPLGGVVSVEVFVVFPPPAAQA